MYTKPWMVELVLGLAGYLLEKRMAEMVALELLARDGAPDWIAMRDELG